ncbi:hypothetical protein FHP25_26515 [Vineibacter terrae]|uniref:Hedgehog/Intein (Hint) domain-containing protein n=1 Tax=Vineibacter terrae TaxID=2586908 RepID=A0A5C8PEW2_9HYPH|nr:hypothetical protein FHP25_26515 [Vineibacter terrae]
MGWRVEPAGSHTAWYSPNADLCLTAWHPVYVDGFLIPIGDLVNGTSITFEAAGGRDTLDFFNIELDRHDILDVQGAFCESLCRAVTERCAPLLRLTGGRSQLRSRMRSVASIVVDRRQPIDIIRDKLARGAQGRLRARSLTFLQADPVATRRLGAFTEKVGTRIGTGRTITGQDGQGPAVADPATGRVFSQLRGCGLRCGPERWSVAQVP